MTDEAIFIENRCHRELEQNTISSFLKPFFDRGKAWSFSTSVRYIYFDKSENRLV
jgi:hypothetical protein